MQRQLHVPTVTSFAVASRLSVAGLLSACLLLAGGGCFHPEKTRAQAGDEDKDRILDVYTIADVTDVGNVLPLQVQGIGLVTGLEGTGGGAPPGELRKMLENDLRRMKRNDAKQLLDSHENALVVVTGLIAPGSRRADLFDVQITLPPGSKVTSLRGGYLQVCYLRLYDTKLHLDPGYKKQDGVVAGHQVAKASGHLIVGLNEAGAPDTNLLAGVIWEGGQSFIDRPYHFLLQDKRKRACVADAVAQRINTMYQDDPQKRLEVLRLKDLLVLDEVEGQINAKFNQTVIGGRDTAKAASKEVVYVNVPWEYRHNSQRYILVARLLPLAEPKEKRQAYQQHLKVMLLDPAQTVRAALRLEALGKESVPILKTALDNAHPLVRFAGAEALAYLGDNSGVAELARLAEQHFQLRAYCLIALATLDQTSSRTKLTEMLATGRAETRYGAFRALQLLNVTDPGIVGQSFNGCFRLHRVAPQSPGLVHYALNHRAEVVLFGQTPALVPPFRMLVGKEYTITAARDDKLCTISRYQLRQTRPSHEQCSLQLADVLRTLADMGAEYPEVVELLRQLEDQKCLNCPICINAMPQPTAIDDLARSGLDNKQWGLAPPWAPNATARPTVAPAHYQTAVSQP